MEPWTTQTCSTAVLGGKTATTSSGNTKHTMNELAVVILNYNGQHHMAQFLPSVIAHSTGAEVVVIDNGSTDASLDWLKAHAPSVRVITLDKNYGFAGGYNEGLKRIQGQYANYLLMNSDVEVPAGYLPALLSRIQDPQVGAVQPKILSYNEKHLFEHAGACGGFIDRNGFPFCRGRIFSECEADSGQYDSARTIFWASGACFLIKSELFHELGGFDAAFFAHMEEIDLCWRLQHSGYEIWVEPKSKVYHLGGGTLSYDSPRKTYLNFRNNLFMLVKNQQGFWLGRLLVRMTWDGIAAWQFLLKGKAQLFFAVFKAHMALYAALPRLVRQRKKPVNAKISGKININIIMQFYLRKKKTFQQLGL